MRESDVDEFDLRKLSGDADENIAADRSGNPGQEQKRDKDERDTAPDQLELNTRGQCTVRPFDIADFDLPRESKSNDRAFKKLFGRKFWPGRAFASHRKRAIGQEEVKSGSGSIRIQSATMALPLWL